MKATKLKRIDSWKIFIGWEIFLASALGANTDISDGFGVKHMAFFPIRRQAANG
jgi:hypothetical protein